MLETVQQVIDFYMKNLKIPEISELSITDKSLLDSKGSFFVTIYYKGEIRGSAGNVREVKNNSVEELIQNSVSAISNDSRFSPITLNELPEIKIRVDKITEREILKDKKIKNLDPTKSGVIAIKKDYSKMAAILPNINAKLFSGEDFIPVLEKKLGEKKFDENDYIVYEIKTSVETNF